jgi:septal ring factor EnvC (AmiA/AmiB activator)
MSGAQDERRFRLGLGFVGVRGAVVPKMSDIDLSISSLMAAFKASITKNDTELDAVIAKLEEVKRLLTESDSEAQRLAAKRLKYNAHLCALDEKTEAAKETLDKLMLQTADRNDITTKSTHP